jgi:hypothetical protein
MITAISNAKKGDRIWVYNIFVDFNDTLRGADNIYLKITD